jgi:regulatory protein
MDLLALREHFSKELATKLRLREYGSDEIAEALEMARESNWLSDERACESYVRMRMGKGYGRQKILAELYERGASDALIERWLPVDREIWQQVLTELCQKRFDLVAGDTLTPKQLRFLLNRGFSLSLIQSHLRPLYATR